MAKVTFKGLYIDDQPEDLEYSRLLGSDGVSFKPIQAPLSVDELISTIMAEKPDIVAIDYRLDEQSATGGDCPSYKAGGPAQLLRERVLDHPSADFPIALVSTEAKISTLFKPDRTAHDLFDEWYEKRTISTEANRVRRELLSLAEGYKSIAAALFEAEPHTKLLDIPEDELEILDADSLFIEISGTKVVHVCSQILMKNLIKRSGILLSKNDVFSRMGLSYEGENNHQALDRLADAEGWRYSGVFHSGWPRYWRHKVDTTLFKIFGVQFNTLTSDSRAKVLTESLGMNLAPAYSKWARSFDEKVVQPCVVRTCRAPTERRHSVGVFEPPLAPHALRQRICFDCLEANKDLDQGLVVAPVDKEIADSVRSGEIKRPE